MHQFLHDIRVAAWGYATKHPNALESRIQIGWPVTLRRLYLPGSYEVRFRKPYLRIAAAFELETAYLNK